MNQDSPLTILCLASYFKGAAFIKQCKALGHKVVLVTREKLADEPWPHDHIDEFFKIGEISKQPDITYAISYLARERAFDLIVPLDEYDIGTAAQLREHLRIPGMGETTARYFRDKLAMRLRAQQAGLKVPQFVHALNNQRMGEFMERVPGPWLLKPRAEAASVGIKKIDHPDELWAKLNELGDRHSFYVLERYVAGEVFHVDALTMEREVQFAIAHRYAQPPLKIAQGGGVFITQTMPHNGETTQALLDFNAQLVQHFGLIRGATHAEFIKSEEDGQLYFLEMAARVGGVNIDQLVEAATGLNLWQEWAKIEIAHLRGEPYTVPPTRQAYGGLMICLAKQEQPNLSAYQDAEIVWRMPHKPYHVGLIVAHEQLERVQALLEEYSHRFAHDFLAVAPPTETPPE